MAKAKRKAKAATTAKARRKTSARNTASRKVPSRKASRGKASPRKAPTLVKRDPALPALRTIGRMRIVIRAGTVFNGRRFANETSVTLPAGGLVAGTDYVVVVSRDGAHARQALETAAVPYDVLGGFHVAPGGNAAARAGGDETPAINPCSMWDIAFRPACPDPRGMTLVTLPDGGRFWCDIYLTGADHLTSGTSRHGVTIADGASLPHNGEEGRFARFDYAAAQAVMALHGKQLLSYDEFRAAACGVTEKTARKGDPERTGLDAPRTSGCGVMQATGNLWVWGHDGDPDVPRASLFGGSWLGDDSAGSRHALVAFSWPVYSYVDIGARGRSDHLQPVSPPRQRRR